MFLINTPPIQKGQAGKAHLRHDGQSLSQGFKKIICSHTIGKCTLTIEDITFNNTIFGSDLGLPERKTMQTTLSMVVQGYKVVPTAIHQLNHHRNMSLDILYVNSFPFLVTFCCLIKYNMSMFIKNRKWSQLVMNITKFMKLYAK